jgi:hypothetical protein
MTTQEQLDAVNVAITKILTEGQEYSLSELKIKRPMLADLYSERNRLESKLASEDGNGVFVAEFDRR